jgi:RHS repeat-associated protein
VGELMTSYSHLSSTPGQNERADTLKLTFQGQQLIRENQLVQNPNTGSVDLELATRHYFGADDKLMAVQRYSYRGPSFSDGTWEEYWYDALGRRVLTRARRDPSSIYDAFTSGPLCMGGIHCRSFTERVWWDGDQALVEERTPESTTDVSNSGLVGNIHGLTLDEPLAVISDQTRIINYNWRGQGESSVFPSGQAGDASLGNSATEIDWPALTQAQTYFTPGPGSGGGSNPKRWMGTFVANGQGTTGMLYRRNRYFSPVSGQFTQSDPIGIAGGMNAFGFAEGDPVNFSDPFGLCPQCIGAGLGAIGGVALGYISARVAGTEYTLKDAGVDALLGAAAGAGIGWLAEGSNLVRGTRSGARLLESKQGKHVEGANNYQPGRSILTHKDPQALLDEFAGTGQPVSGTRGMPGFKERVDFREQIGLYVDPQTGVATPTQRGIIHYSKEGAHIVPARPK